jgi:hypothetical protein
MMPSYAQRHARICRSIQHGSEGISQRCAAQAEADQDKLAKQAGNCAQDRQYGRQIFCRKLQVAGVNVILL